ncbi:Putative GTPase (G3E family) [gamma proteobacterium IMCC1989]|nr:Putative GTPase (G3E family) [gamma proteobacterium IMCC1989]
MNTPNNALSAIPTHIITGFLGVGKTSAILHLLSNKPNNERWAILVNEFGEVGVDGSIFEGQQTQENTVFIKEVPGGCMCCTAGLPMQVALNQLLKKAKPDRLFIEPTGLGHPKEVLESLTSDAYRDVIALQKVLTLVDARKLSDTRYTEHATFNQQIAIADIVVGNKQDLYQDGDKNALIAYAGQHGIPEAQVFFTQQGDITTIDLMGSTSTITSKSHHNHDHDHDQSHSHSHSHSHKHNHNHNQNHNHSHKDNHVDKTAPSFSDEIIPECGYIKAVNKGEGFYSIGWRFSPSKPFNHQKIMAFLKGINAERMKAVLITEKGAFTYNLTSDALVEHALNDCNESRIEIITTDINENWEAQIMACLILND